MLNLRAGTATHPGLVRERNEDSLVAYGLLFAVADGMGGHAAGDVASQIAVERLQHLAASEQVRPDDVSAALHEANAEILASVAEHDEREGMGTTIAGITVVQVGGTDHWIVFNIGDSRVYRLASGQLTRVTNDHSEVNEMIASGQLTEEQARSYQRRNVITRSLGSEPAPDPDLWVFPPTAGERFLICSDGLHGDVMDDAIADVLRTEPDAQLAADRLIRLAIEAGGHDNITVVVLDSLEAASATTSLDANTAPRIHHMQCGSSKEELQYPSGGSLYYHLISPDHLVLRLTTSYGRVASYDSLTTQVTGPR